MNTDANTAVETSATAPVEADGWDENGTPIATKKPESPKPEESAASATPAKEAKPEGKPKSAAESGAAKNEPKPKAKPTAEERISELTAERKAAISRAEAAEERLRKLESSAQTTSKAEAKPDAKKEAPKRPDPFTWKGTPEEYNTAMDEWEAYRDVQAAARIRQEQAQTEAQKSMSEMMKQAAEKHPDAKEKITEATNEIMGESTPFFVKAFVNESEVIGELLYALADKTTLNNVLEKAKTNPGMALRALHIMELDIQKALSKPEAKPEEKAPENKPRAPKPPSEVGGRGAATEDAAVSAARDGNFGAFGAEQERRYFSASR